MFQDSQSPPVCMQPLVNLFRSFGKLSVIGQICEGSSRPILHRPVTWLTDRDWHKDRDGHWEHLVR